MVVAWLVQGELLQSKRFAPVCRFLEPAKFKKLALGNWEMSEAQRKSPVSVCLQDPARPENAPKVATMQELVAAGSCWSSALLGDDPLVIAMESTRCHSEGVQYGHKSNKSPPQRCMLSCAPVLLHNLLSFVSHSPKFGALVGVAGSDRLQLRWNPAMLKYLYADNDVQCQDLAFSFTGM